MDKKAEVATAESANDTPSVLTDAQVSEFWASFMANHEVARRMAAHFVPRQDVDDVVHSAAVLFMDSMQRPIEPAPFPASEEEFRRRLLHILRNYALDCVRDADAEERNQHFREGIEAEPRVGGHYRPDRPLDEVFARNDRGVYDAPAENQIRPQDDVDQLHVMLREAVADLPQMQRTIVGETFFDGRKRAEVARRHGISVKTYDNAMQAAFKNLRWVLSRAAEDEGDIDRSVWYERIDQLSHNYHVIQGKRLAKRWVVQIDSATADSKPGGARKKKSGAGGA